MRAIALLATLALFSACAGGPNRIVNSEEIAKEEARLKEQRLAAMAFDRVATSAHDQQWQYALDLRKNHSGQNEYIDTFWNTRSSNIRLAWLIGMSNSPRRDAHSLRTFPAPADKDNLKRAELWLKRALEEASRKASPLLPEVRYDYARILVAKGEQSKAVEVLVNRSEVEPIAPELENLYQALLNSLAR